jgi:hypothetical protein
MKIHRKLTSSYLLCDKATLTFTRNNTGQKEEWDSRMSQEGRTHELAPYSYCKYLIR